ACRLVTAQDFKSSCRARFASGVGSIPTHSRHDSPRRGVAGGRARRALADGFARRAGRIAGSLPLLIAAWTSSAGAATQGPPPPASQDSVSARGGSADTSGIL